MAGVAALLNQKVGSAQGNFNPLLYRLATNSPSAFHDATPATSGVVSCDINTPSMCNNSTPSSTALTGGLAGYALTTGYDQATGLGSLDVTSFLTAAAAAPNPAITTLTLSSALASINTSQTVTFTATLGPSSLPLSSATGTVQFYVNGSALGSPVAVANGIATSPGKNFPTVGSNTITATYSGDSSFATSTAAPLTVNVIAAPSASTVTTLAIPASLTVGSSTPFSATVAPAVTSTNTPSGSVQFFQGSTSLGTAVLLTVGGKMTALFPTPVFSSTGSFPITAVYLGDANFLGSTSAPQTLTVAKVTSNVTLSASTTTLTVGGTDTFTATVAHNGTIVPTGTVQFLQGTTSLGTFTLSSGTAISSTQTFSTVGSFPITANYSGDSNFSAATSSAITIVVNPAPTYQLSASPSSLSLVAGATSSNTSTINLSETGGFTGTVNLTCKVAYNGTATLNYIPTCSLANSSVAINAAAASTTLAVVTTVPHAIKGTNVVAGLGGRVPILFVACLFCLLPVRRRLSWKMFSFFFLLTAAIGGLSGCSGGSSGNTSTPQTLVGTTTGSYTITVTATSAAAASNPSPVTIALTVN